MPKPSSSNKNKQNQIVKSALEVFMKKGYGPSRIQDIAARAGVGKGTFYLYFQDKEELVHAVVDHFISEIKLTLEWVQGQMTEADFESGLVGIKRLFTQEAKQLVASMLKHQRTARFLFREGKAVSASVERKLQKFEAELVSMAENTFALAMHAGLLRKQNPRVAALCVVGGIMHNYLFWLEQKNTKEGSEEIEQMTQDVVDFFMQALAGSVPPAPAERAGR